VFGFNGVQETVTPENGRNTISLGRQNVQEENVFTVRSNGTFEMEDAVIRSEITD